MLYVVGVAVGNIGLLPKESAQIQDLLTSITIPIAIPLMLFGYDFRMWSLKKALVALISGILSVAMVIVATFFIFENGFENNPLVGEEGAKLAGLLSGVYTGGTPNLAALKLMLDVPNETYILVHSYDMVISFLYLVFLLSFGIKLFRKILPASKEEDRSKEIDFKEENYRDIFTKKGWKPTLGALGISLMIVAISVGTSFLFTGEITMVIVILLLTTLGIATSFVPKVRKIDTSFSVGMYLILIFSLVVSSMADLTKMNFADGLTILLLLGCVVFGSLVIQTIFAKIFKIDADTMIVTSVSLINSPPFAPMICSAMNNRNVLITGLSVGIVGYAVGNYLGFLIYNLLKLL